MNEVATGYHRGTGSAINVSLGYVPELVIVTNLTDGDKIHMNALHKVAAFTSGSSEIQAGDRIKGVTSSALATVRQVILDSGTYAGGDAAGWIVLEHDDQSGTFSGENIGVVTSDDDTPSNEATLSAAFDQDGVDIDTEVAGTTTAATNVSAYNGDADNAPGFTIGATISEDGKLLHYVALRSGAGVGVADIAAP